MTQLPAPLAFAVLRSYTPVRRVAWVRENWMVDAVMSEFDDGPVLTRINGDTRWPWSPTDDDLFADDWEVPGGGLFSPRISEDGSFAWALHEVREGRRVRFAPNSPLVLARADVFGAPCIALGFPGGARRVWRPQHQDIWRKDYAAA